MSKRPACNASLEPLLAAPKKPRLDDGTRRLPNSFPRVDRPKSNKRPFLEDADEGKAAVTPHHVSKKARIDESPTEFDARSPSPSPWPSIDQHIPDEHPSKEILQEWQREVHEAIDRSEAAFRHARQEYARFRENRLPSPAPSDEEPAVDDSETDEFGYCPIMLNLDNDDPEVEDVFGAAYAHRIRGRPRQHAPTVRPQKVFSPPPSTNNQTPKEQSKEEKVTPSKQQIIVETRGAASSITETEAPQPFRSHSQKLHYSTRLRTAQTYGRKIRSSKREAERVQPSARPSQTPTKIAEIGVVDESDILFSGRRFTRQSRPQRFYELDCHSRPRVMLGC